MHSAIAVVCSAWDFLKELGEYSRYQASLLPCISSAHCEGLAGACLAVGEDGTVITFQTTSRKFFLRVI
jgi:hypothetical protein